MVGRGGSRASGSRWMWTRSGGMDLHEALGCACRGAASRSRVEWSAAALEELDAMSCCQRRFGAVAGAVDEESRRRKVKGEAKMMRRKQASKWEANTPDSRAFFTWTPHQPPHSQSSNSSHKTSCAPRRWRQHPSSTSTINALDFVHSDRRIRGPARLDIIQRRLSPPFQCWRRRGTSKS